MKATFTQRLTRSLAAFLAMGLLALSLLIFLQSDRVSDPTVSESDEFIPARLVEWRSVVAAEVLAALSEQSESSRRSLEAGTSGSDRKGLTCSGRGPTVMKNRLQLSDFQFERIFLRSRKALGADFNCFRFLDTLEWVSRQRQLISIENETDRQAAIASASTERVSWSALPPCLFVRTDTGELGLLAGPRGRCDSSVPVVDLPQNARVLGQWAYRSSVANESVNGRLSAPRQLELSTDLLAQRALESVVRCIYGSSTVNGCSDTEKRLRQQVGSLSIAVVNQSTGAIAAMACEGMLCEQAGLEGSEPLSPLLVQSPPASTAKLFVGLALSSESSSVDHTLLSLQLKTSGQIDDVSKKRNEWWERNIICDGSKRANPGNQRRTPIAQDLKTIDCRVASSAEQIAVELGFNQTCDGPNDLRCGRVDVGTPRSSIPAFLGQFFPRPVDRKDSYLNWSQYDRIRTGQSSVPRPPLDQAYLRTSRSVQSVLGAGDARISALGLAHVSGQIVSRGLGLSTKRPWLLKEVGDLLTSSAGGQLRAVSQSSLGPVVAGMNKVMQPSEARWEGNGTAYSAVKAIWGPNLCRSTDCPLWGKTGTVGRADKVFGRTTVFSGAFLWAPLREAMIEAGHVPMSTTRDGVWSLGVIVTPRSSTQNAEGHAASQLSMLIVDRLVRGAEVAQ